MRGVARRDRAAVAAGEVLGRVKREDRRLREVAGADAVALHLDAVRRVFDDEEPASIGDRAERPHVGELAVEVHRKDAHRLRADRRAHGRRVDEARRRLDVDEARRRPEVQDRVRRRGERHRRRDDLVARPDVERPQGEEQAHRARVRPDHVRRRRVRSRPRTR